MKEILRRSAAALAAVITLAGMASCSSNNTDTVSQEDNLVGSPAPGNSANESDMPYGSTVATLIPNEENGAKLEVEYDRRFFTEEEASMLGDFIYSLGTGDVSAVENEFYPPVLNYYCEMTKQESSSEYFSKLHDNYEAILGNGFVFDKVYIENCFTDTDPGTESGMAFNDVSTMLDDLSEEGNKISDKVDEASRRYIYLDATYTLPGSTEELSLRNAIAKIDSEAQYLQMLMYTIDGTTYIF